MSHLRHEDLLLFAAGEAGKDAVDGIYAHLAECNACTERFQAIRRIREDFDGSLERFAQEYRSRSVAAGKATRPIEQRVKVLVRGVIDGAKNIAVAAVDEVRRPRGGWAIDGRFVPAYSGVGDKDRDQLTRKLVTDASESVARGEDDDARRLLEKASISDPGRAGTATVELLLDGNVVGRVIADAARHAVDVLIRPEYLEGQKATAVLTPETEPNSPRRQLLEEALGAGYLLAEFRGVPDGGFTLGIELE